MMMLGPDQDVPRRPFTSVKRYPPDLATLNSMVEDLRNIIASAEAGSFELTLHQWIPWKVAGRRRRMMVCDGSKLLKHKKIWAVGFFAERNLELDMGPLEKANSRIVRHFQNYPGILSYGSYELPEHNWANLVLHDDPEVAERWSEIEAHSKAVSELSPVFYQNVRIHRGRIPGGLQGGNSIVIERTKYYDYRSSKVWKAIRQVSS